MNWAWVGLGLTVPTLAAMLVALPVWLRGDPMTGSVVGAGVIFLAVILLIGREYVELEQARLTCVAADFPCRFRPQAFTRYAIHCGVGFADAIVVFIVGLNVERRRMRRDFAPEWR